jgi:hypothetical protein
LSIAVESTGIVIRTAQHFVRLVRDVRAVGHDDEPVAIGLVAVGDAGRDLHQAVVVLAEEDLLELAHGQRTGAQVVHDELGPAGDDGVVDRHALMDVPGLDGARPGAGEVDLAEAGKVRVGGFEHVHDLAALVGDLA